MVNKISGKKGWIRIVEAFVAILLTAGVLLLVVGEEHLINPNPDSEIYDAQLIILRDIQRDDTLRQSVLGALGEVPLDIETRIEYLAPSYLECEAKICVVDTTNCNLEELPEKSIYAQTVLITVTETQEGEMNPKQLKVFCWRK